MLKLTFVKSVSFVKDIIKNIKDAIKNIPIDKNAVFAGIAVVGIIVAGAIIYMGLNPDFSLSNLGFFGPSDKQLADKAVDYINNNGLTQSPASLVSVSEESGLVKIKIKVGVNEFDSYITKDGKLLFPTALKMDGNKNSSSQNDQASDKQVAQTCDSLEKTANPMIEAYVVSRCPYGLQMQRAMSDAVKNVPSLAQYLKVRYIGSVDGNTVTSMHGDEEAKENLRQICIREEQASEYWNYVACQMQTGDTAGCEASTGIDSAKLNACVSAGSRGAAYAKEDFNLAAKYNVQGSPTLIVDGVKTSEFDFGGRSSDAIKTICCCASSTEPTFCSTKLNTAEAAVSFSPTYESSASNSDSTSCGQ